jgi:hypothetical protein
MEADGALFLAIITRTYKTLIATTKAKLLSS